MTIVIDNDGRYLVEVSTMKNSYLTPSFSKMTKLQKINYLAEQLEQDPDQLLAKVSKFWHQDQQIQKTIDEFSENTLSNFIIPYGVVPNVLINQKWYQVPMAIEESSVVAACSKAAKYWATRGGFQASVVSTTKIGHVHLHFEGKSEDLRNLFELNKQTLLSDLTHIVGNMNKRGGGVTSLELVDKTLVEENYYQLEVKFETCDAMGANFINSCLEQLGASLKQIVEHNPNTQNQNFLVIMAILSNYTPECIVKVKVSSPVTELDDPAHGISPELFATKFVKAVKIAKIEPYRATTHNKGIFNGVDAVVVATGNDFRAVEAAGHTYACRDGQYRSLTSAYIENDIFNFEITLPLALGTIGGLTSLHPMAKTSLDLLGHPTAPELMQIVASIGLAQNFAAIRSLVTSGIQKGHMKMHLFNILNHLEASEDEKKLSVAEFEDKVISFNSVRNFIASIRGLQ